MDIELVYKVRPYKRPYIYYSVLLYAVDNTPTFDVANTFSIA